MVLNQWPWEVLPPALPVPCLATHLSIYPATCLETPCLTVYLLFLPVSGSAAVTAHRGLHSTELAPLPHLTRPWLTTQHRVVLRVA
ncbi:hypothetical protein DPMN_018360 [Dreissena polymorpha]|uniref:Uncharacterized protein n=1 Tax=Dreissena polymorpha TaxID=45954 RepID=A0A9D4NGI5_DREPO|nr:hypothetical protein DPMN_018360 [Dreissena polymorpha]